MSLIPHHVSDAVCPLCEVKLSTADPYLGAWFRSTVKIEYPDMHVSWGFRNKAQQDDCVAEGKSRAPWPTSAHNNMAGVTPMSLAIDLFQINTAGRAVWDPVVFAKINHMNLLRQIPIFWGGHFKTISDNDHFSLKNG